MQPRDISSEKVCTYHRRLLDAHQSAKYSGRWNRFVRSPSGSWWTSLGWASVPPAPPWREPSSCLPPTTRTLTTRKPQGRCLARESAAVMAMAGCRTARAAAAPRCLGSCYATERRWKNRTERGMHHLIYILLCIILYTRWCGLGGAEAGPKLEGCLQNVPSF